MILTLLFCSSFMLAQDDKELVTCKFLDEFYDYKVSYTLQQDDEQDTLFLNGPAMIFEAEEGYDLTSTE